MVAAKLSPVTPSVLRWALAEDGRSVLEVAGALRVEPAELEAWARGDAQPVVGQVSDLARVLQRPRVLFFLPSPPTRSALPDGFRHPPGGGDRSVSAEVLKHARRAKRIQLAIASTVEDDERPDVPRASIGLSPRAAAEQARLWLEVPPRVRWKDDHEALRWWKGMLETAGILVFDLQLGKNAPRGFAAWDDRAPLIVLNSTSVSAAARIYTIGHELAHLLLREATACVSPTGSALTVDNRTERWCEQFAAAFLMPADELGELMTRHAVKTGEASLEADKATMAAFRVSARASAVRLNGLGYASEGLYGVVLAVFKTTKRTPGKPHNPPRHKMRLRQYGTSTVTTILDSLPPSDAMSVLRLNVEDVRSLADEVPGVRAL